MRGGALSQRTMVVVPSRTRLEGDHPRAAHRALMTQRESGRRLELGDRHGVGHGHAEDTHGGHAACPDTGRRRGRQNDRLHVMHPAWLAFDVCQHGPHPLDGRVDDNERLDRRGWRATGPRPEHAIGGPASSEAGESQADERTDHASARSLTASPSATASRPPRASSRWRARRRRVPAPPGRSHQ